MENKLYDKTGREIMFGDVLKVLHFIGARKKKYYMYKWVVAKETRGEGPARYAISHMDDPTSLLHDYYVELLDGRILENVEIVQGRHELPNGNMVEYEDRPRITLPRKGK